MLNSHLKMKTDLTYKSCESITAHLIMCSKDATIIQRLLERLTPLREGDVACMDIRWKNVRATEVRPFGGKIPLLL
jgi:hypothetical protein